MKLAEAYLEKSNLERQVELLKSRLLNDSKVGLDTRALVEEVQRKANLLRDIMIAIDWTEQHSQVSGLPLGAYRRRVESLEKLAGTLENVSRERADLYYNSAHTDRRFIENAIWVIDLQLPQIEEQKK